jgi:hypothetical protein
MIPISIRYEKPMRSLIWLPIGLAMGAFLLALHETPPAGLPFLNPDFAPQYLFYPALFFWAIISPYMLAFGATRRCGRHQMALPLRTRELWLSHVVALGGSALAILGVAVVVIITGSHLQGSPGIEAGLRMLIINVAAFTLLAFMLVQSLATGLNEIDLTPTSIAIIACVYVGLFLLLPLVSGLPVYWVVLPLAAAAGLGIRVYNALPSAFELATGNAKVRPPGDAGRGPGRIRDVRAAGTMGVQHVRMSVHSLVVRALINPVLTPAICFVLFIFGYRNAGYISGGTSNLVFAYWAVVAMSALVVTSVPRLHLLDALPVPRKTIFAYLVLPGLLVGFAGYSIGTLAGKGRVSGSSLVEYEERYYDDQLDVRIPFEFWELSRSGRPAPLEPCCDQPNGAWSVSLFRGTNLVLYNPYHAPADSSPDLVAHQFNRAVEAVYGRSIPVSELRERYFHNRPGGGTMLGLEHFDLTRDFPGLEAVGWSRSLAATMLVLGVLWLVYLSAVLRGGYSRIRVGHVVLTIFGVAYLFSLIWTSSRGYTQEWKLSAAAGIVVRKAAEALPGSTLSLWIFTIIALMVCFLIARTQFGKMEIPAEGSRRQDM